MPSGGTTVPGTAPVREAHRFDVHALETYLRGRLPGFAGLLEVRQFLGGQSNPTYHLRSASGDYVLRRKPPGKLLPSAHAVEREFRVIAALRGTGVPVPEALVLCEDPDVVGTVFYVMRLRAGRILPQPRLARAHARRDGALWDDAVASSRASTRSTGGRRARRLRETGQLLCPAAPPLGGPVPRLGDRKIPAMERLIEWLPAHMPADDFTTLVHGDFRIGNTVVHSTEPRILAVLDWELSTLGHPLGDLGYLCTAFRMPPGIDGFGGLDLAALGIPTEAEVVARYCRLTGRDDVPSWEFYVAFALFRLAAICQGIMGRVRDGTASDPDARRRGERARPLAEAAWAVVDRAA